MEILSKLIYNHLKTKLFSRLFLLKKLSLRKVKEGAALYLNPYQNPSYYGGQFSPKILSTNVGF